MMRTVTIDKYFEKIAQHIVCNATLSNQHLHIKFPKETFASEIADFNLFTSLPELLNLYKGVVMVVGKVAIDETEGLRDRFFVPMYRALAYYQQGATLEFDFVERFFNGLQKFIVKFQTFLQLPSGVLGKAICYASPNASGFPMHFDAYYNFIFQITGKKKWILQHNANADFPLQHYDFHEYPYLPTELGMYWKKDIKPPLGDTDNLIIEELEAGSMLYLPRGLWHQTEASDSSFSLNITFSLPSVIDLLLAALRKKMVPYTIARSTPLKINKEDYKCYANLLEAAQNDLQLSDLIAQLGVKHDAYQQGNKTFHAMLECLQTKFS
ncbi:MAG: cupin-like domain-containing protein [Candidatus Cardinium sp.]|nr:cupin-like domain-containing protein [Candidatus Cardinium sp.]